MRRPGDRLRALAACVFDAQAMERLVDPVIADLQAEDAPPPARVECGQAAGFGWPATRRS